MPHIPLDALFWLPNWGKTPHDEFRANVRAAMDQSERGWVIDGNYTKRLGTIVQDEATDIICKNSFFSLSHPPSSLRFDIVRGYCFYDLHFLYRARSPVCAVLSPAVPPHVRSSLRARSAMPRRLSRTMERGLCIS